MRQSILAALLILALPSVAFAQIAQELQDYLNSLSGLEGAGTQFGFDFQGTNTTIELIGFGFCLPEDPSLPPASPPTPPDNVYGCTNDVTVVGTPSADPPGIDLVLSADRLFLDLFTTRDRTLLCGEPTSGQETGDAYATMLISLLGSVQFVEQNDCVRWVSVPGSGELLLEDFEIQFDDFCLDTYSGLILETVLPSVRDQLEFLLIDVVEEYLAARNETACGVALLPVNWSTLKARFDPAGGP